MRHVGKVLNGDGARCALAFQQRDASGAARAEGEQSELILRQEPGVTGMAGADGVLLALAGQWGEGDDVFAVDVGDGLVEALRAAQFNADFHDFVEGGFGIRAEG